MNNFFKYFIFFNLLILIIPINATTIKDYFSVVFVSEKAELEMFDNIYKKNVIAKIPGGTKNLKTTWRTTREKDIYYIEIKYEDKIGWVNRAFLTRGFDLFNSKNEPDIDKILLNFTAAIQQQNGERFLKSFYSLKGCGFYINNNFYYIEYSDIRDFFFKSLKNKDYILYGILEKFLMVLEKKFQIYYNEKNEEIKNISELKNFQTVSLIYNDKKIIVCVEKIMEKFYISGIFINY